MVDIQNLLNQVASAEAHLRDTPFLAPCVLGGRIRTRVAGMVYTFRPNPRQFEGWGIFQPEDEQTAALVDEADGLQVSEYLHPFSMVRLRLAYRLQHQTWLAYPVNEADMAQRFGRVNPMPVHLVSGGIAFEQIVARWSGGGYWFENIDRRSDPLWAETLQSALKQLTPIEALAFKGLTPEMRSLYALVAQKTEGFPQPDPEELRLQRALKLGGGDLQQFQDHGDYWQVAWTTADGVPHHSAIAKQDLTVISAGICLSGRDRDFDLQSLVGVIAGWQEEP